jgi:hypothetical protein
MPSPSRSRSRSRSPSKTRSRSPDPLSQFKKATTVPEFDHSNGVGRTKVYWYLHGDKLSFKEGDCIQVQHGMDKPHQGKITGFTMRFFRDKSIPWDIVYKKSSGTYHVVNLRTEADRRSIAKCPAKNSPNTHVGTTGRTYKIPNTSPNTFVKTVRRLFRLRGGKTRKQRRA